MSVLNITNLTDRPEELLSNNIDNAIKAYENENDFQLSDEQKEHMHNYYDSLIEEYDDKHWELLNFVDNLLVNEDYYATVKDELEIIKGE
jgi:arylsulfatase A-like enzyme